MLSCSFKRRGRNDKPEGDIWPYTHSSEAIALSLFVTFGGEPLPQGTVISATDRTILTKMDRNGRMIRLSPDDLRVVPPEPIGPVLEATSERPLRG